MAISMQGSWTVRVRSKDALFKQRFVIFGATSGNGTYNGVPGTAAIVSGTTWGIRIQHDPGTGWKDSQERIKFPTHVGTEYRFDIESNDTGGDKDFNDLVLTCSMPATQTDFLLYGNVKTYSGRCIFNPCSYRRPWYVIDDIEALEWALHYPAIREQIKVLYPEELIPRPPNPPDPLPFRPRVIPFGTQQALPPKQVQVLELAQTNVAELKLPAAEAKGKKGDAATAELPEEPLRVIRSQTATIAEVVPNTKLLGNALTAASILDKIRPLCSISALPDFVLRFQEYDRTAAELVGGAYTGTGARSNLGETLTDMNGNYVFRFSMSIPEIVEETLYDVPAGGNAAVQAMPDIIVQALDSSVSGGVVYESAPYWNVPLLKRIDICIPKRRIPTAPACVGGQIIQSVGNINLGPLVGGIRTTSNTFLGSAGRITSRSSIGPAVNCAAWAGSLYLYACLNNTDIKFYTIRYRRGGGWQFVTEQHTQYRLLALPPWEIEESVKVVRSLEIDGAMTADITCYKNAEADPLGTWKLRWVQLKMKLSSLLYELALAGPGTVHFRIEGYRADGTKVPAADDTVSLYVDNRSPDLYLDPQLIMVDLIGNTTVSQGDCALFTLPAGAFNAPIRMKFRADHLGGFLNAFGVNAEKGSTGAFAISGVTNPVPPPALVTAYTHGDDLACNSFQGTIEAAQYDAVNRLLTYDVTPAAGDWLGATEPFCAFRFYISATVRVTDGQTIPGPYYSGSVLIGIQKP